MAETAKQKWSELGRTLAISFVIATAFHFGAPASVAPKHPVFLFVSGLVFGLAFFAAGYLMSLVRLRSFLITVLVRSAIIIANLVICFCIIVITGGSIAYRVSFFHPALWRNVGNILVSPTTLILFSIAFSVALSINAVHQVSRKLGPGVMWNWMTGKYHTPKEIDRIFMFLDLKDSTTLAEQLGPVPFSSLVRDFFSDLTTPVIESKGEVSHYIGDEAVLCWKPKTGFENANCIRIFFLMKEEVKKREPYYLKRYGVVPSFKAGVHVGPVVATEVGQIKSEIVFHGDTLNTTARITGHCAIAESDLLVSADVLSYISLPANLQAVPKGTHVFKGKAQAVEVFAIEAPATA